MPKKPTNNPRPPRETPRPVPVHATAARFDGGAVKIEFVFQPEGAAQLTDQIVNALMREGRRR